MCYVYEENVQQELKLIVSQDTKGVILLGTELREENFAPFEDFSLPLVVLDTYFEGISKDCILINNVQGAFLDPPMTTIHVPKQAMGQLAVEQLLRLIQKRSAAPVKIEVGTALIKRGTL